MRIIKFEKSSKNKIKETILWDLRWHIGGWGSSKKEKKIAKQISQEIDYCDDIGLYLKTHINDCGEIGEICAKLYNKYQFMKRRVDIGDIFKLIIDKNGLSLNELCQISNIPKIDILEIWDSLLDDNAAYVRYQEGVEIIIPCKNISENYYRYL